VHKYAATFLIPIRRREQLWNIGAAVDHRGHVVIVAVPDDLPLSIHEATEFQKKIREAVMDASMRRS
jgi:hypothetical protein